MKKLVTILLLCMSISCFTGCARQANDHMEEMQKNSSEEIITEQGQDVSGTELVDEQQGETEMEPYDFSEFANVEISGVEFSDFEEEELTVLYQLARYSQAMTEADIDTMRELVTEDSIFTHMNGRQQTREAYLADVESGALQYFTAGIENPEIEIDGDTATITHTFVLNAIAYGARGTYHMDTTHGYVKIDGEWITSYGTYKH